MPNHDIAPFAKGVHNLLPDEEIPTDAASDSNNWYTLNGRLVLIPGRLRVGTEGASGSIQGELISYKVDGTKVHWRKAGTVIQYLNSSSVWTTVITGLTASADYWFSSYSSLAGTFTYFFGIDGIYKIHNAVPGTFNSMFVQGTNYKGYGLIDKGRTLLWGRAEDRTGLYGSKIDPQGSNYTTISGEATTSLTGTLAFKAGGATRNCFGVTITLTGTGEVYKDAFLGVLSGSLGGTGTINYLSGAYTLSNAGVGTATYQWEDSNTVGVTDFRLSGTRVAGEGFILRQDQGGDAIQQVCVGLDGAYYSLKTQSAYRFIMGPTDLLTDPSTINQVYRQNMGMPSLRAATSMQKGIVFMNTAAPEKPELTILQRNPIGGETEPLALFAQFKFANYNYDDCHVNTWERFILVFCRNVNSATAFNDTLLLCNLSDGTVDITQFSGRVSVTDAGKLYMGSSITSTVYQLFTGTDDDGTSISNYWISKGDNLRPRTRSLKFSGDTLKKHRLLAFKGHIDPDQKVQVYTNYDNSGWQLVGTIVGSGSYVDSTSSEAVGYFEVGTSQVGADVLSLAFPFFMQMRIKSPRFRKRYIRLIATGIGYVDIEMISDRRITAYEVKLPARFLSKQNVSLDGLSTNVAAPTY